MTHDEPKPGGRAVVVIVACLILAGALGVVLILSLSQKSNQAQGTAQSAKRGVVANAQNATTAKNLAKSAKSKTDKVSRKVDRQVVKLDRTITVLGKAGVNGLPGRSGSTGPPGISGVQGPPGRDAIFPLTPSELIAGVSERLVPRLPSAQDVLDACDGACVGPAGRDGQDATPGQVDAAVDRHCAPLNDCVGPQGVTGDAGPAGQAGATGPTGPAPQPFTYTFTDGTGLSHTCTIDPNAGPAVVQPCT